MAVAVDVVVVGAGVIGSSVAFDLARAGRDVVVVDKGAGAGRIDAGRTGHSISGSRTLLAAYARVTQWILAAFPAIER